MKKIIKTLFFFLLPLQFCFAQWVPTDASLTTADCLAASESYLYTGTYDGYIFISTDNGDNWNSIDSALMLNEVIRAITICGQNVIATGGEERNGQIFLSTDNGTSWNEILTTGAPFYDLFSKDNNVFAGHSTTGVFYSSDSGITWDTVNNGITGNHTIIALAGYDSKTIAGSEGDGVFLTTNNGTSWTQVNNGLSSLHIGALAALDNYIFAGTSAGIYLSSDGGTNWSAINSGLPTDYIEGFNDFGVVGTNIFVSIEFYDGDNHYSRVYLSTNFGEIWNNVSTGLPEEIEYITALAANETYLFAGNKTYLSPWAGVWRRPLSEMITDVDEIISQLPKDYNLGQNYPNPFNPRTKIKYSIPQTSQVQIKVYDVLGNEITTLANEEKLTGTYELNWNANNIPSGVYFVRLQASPPGGKDGCYTAVKKMLLLK